MTNERIQEIVLLALAAANKARDGRSQLDLSPTARLYDPENALDSLGLVALMIDIEEMLAAEGVSVEFADERATSHTRSPFRTVGTLVAFVAERVAEQPAVG